MAVVAAVVLSFTIGKLRSSQSSKEMVLCLAFWKIGSAMMARSVSGEHRRSSSVLGSDLFHETRVFLRIKPQKRRSKEFQIQERMSMILS